jgi:hypothetical protein
MKIYLKTIVIFLCVNVSILFSAETQEDIASRLANDLRAIHLPKVQLGTINEQQIKDFFTQDVEPTGILGNTSVLSDDANFLRTAFDSIGGGNFCASVANTLISIDTSDLAIQRALAENPGSDTYDAYGIMMYQRGLWLQEWASTLSDNARAILGL